MEKQQEKNEKVEVVQSSDVSGEEVYFSEVQGGFFPHPEKEQQKVEVVLISNVSDEELYFSEVQGGFFPHLEKEQPQKK